MNECFNNDLLGLRKRWWVCSNPIPTTQTYCFALVGKKQKSRTLKKPLKAFQYVVLENTGIWADQLLEIMVTCLFLSGLITVAEKEQVEAPWDFWLGYFVYQLRPAFCQSLGLGQNLCLKDFGRDKLNGVSTLWISHISLTFRKWQLWGELYVTHLNTRLW